MYAFFFFCIFTAAIASRSKTSVSARDLLRGKNLIRLRNGLTVGQPCGT